MLCVTYITDNKNTPMEVEWYIGEKLKVYPSFFEEIKSQYVSEIQADGDELEFLKENFVNLPYPKNARVVIWHGDLAKTIFQSIPRDFSRR